MKNTYIAAAEPMTWQQVFAAFLLDHSQRQLASREDRPFLNMPASDLIEDFNWPETSETLTHYVGSTLNDYFGTAIDNATWQRLLDFGSDQTFRDLCIALSDAGARRQPIERFKIAGTACLEAGAFFALRSALCDAGLQLATARPSTPLQPLSTADKNKILAALRKLAPMVHLRPHSMTDNHPFYLMTAVLLLLGASGWFFLNLPQITVICIILASFPFGFICQREYEWCFADVATLGDLARMVARHRRS